MSEKNVHVVVSQAEPAPQGETEKIVALVELTNAQASAIRLLGKSEELDSIARAVLAARIKGDFKRYREAEAKVNAQIYDDSSRRGAKWPMTKDEFIQSASKDSLAIWNALNY